MFSLHVGNDPADRVPSIQPSTRLADKVVNFKTREASFGHLGREVPLPRDVVASRAHANAGGTFAVAGYVDAHNLSSLCRM